jgi:serine/threonine-protein kinase
MLFETNKVIRDYKIIKLIGQGGMGEVYLAEDIMLGKKIALKVLSQELSRNQNLINRFISEAKVQAALLHPNVVTLHSFFKEEGIYIMAMEYAEGRTIKELIHKQGPINEKRAVKICLDILSGLSFAHSKGIIHRDIKSANIMLADDDSIKIMDFGIAKVLGVKGLTETGGKLGTIYYMSPEQIMADPKIDRQTDIYSLGITLYEMLAGSLPFSDTDSQFKVMKEIVEFKLKDPREFYPYISPEVVNVLFKMTAKDRKERYQNCEETAEALKSVLYPVKKTPEVKPQPNIKPVTVPVVPSIKENQTKETSGVAIKPPVNPANTKPKHLGINDEKTLVIPQKKKSVAKIVVFSVIAAVITVLAFIFTRNNKTVTAPQDNTVNRVTAPKKVEPDTVKLDNKNVEEEKNIVEKPKHNIKTQKNIKKEHTNKNITKDKDAADYLRAKKEGLKKPVPNKPTNY